MLYLEPVLLPLFLVLAVCPVRTAAAEVALISVDGTINPATSDFLARAVTSAGEAEDVCLIVQLNTPGGLLESTQDIVQIMYNADVPVVIYVAPVGASATSAGCFITLAAHVAAMAPHTSIGAAHPVTAGGGDAQQLDDTMKEKLVNFASSYIESIAEKRGRNAAWARSAVRESASITSEQALELNVIEIIAENLEVLLQRLDGREIDGEVLRTAGASMREIPMIMRSGCFRRSGGAK